MGQVKTLNSQLALQLLLQNLLFPVRNSSQHCTHSTWLSYPWQITIATTGSIVDQKAADGEKPIDILKFFNTFNYLLIGFAGIGFPGLGAGGWGGAQGKGITVAQTDNPLPSPSSHFRHKLLHSSMFVEWCNTIYTTISNSLPWCMKSLLCMQWKLLCAL